MRDAKFFSANL